ncbi:GNAT family acetyltransferase [Listeria fleischmannii FSL S10-1203]|uniref:GNAT family acetyltransferase n=1 Tax=Listeria fleischmannii FSL S10-1203 TaxID=1265822 RepID=W7DLH8_9LIST|nr:GNAT family acetyltransferase [Listeria fleischmannii FSL S10-1203]
MEFKNGENRIYAVNDEGVEVGEITFTDAGESMFIIDHTGVDDNMRGQGIASELVAHAVSKARAENKKNYSTLPVCKSGVCSKKRVSRSGSQP